MLWRSRWLLACTASKFGKGDLLRFSAMRVVDGLKKWSRGAMTLVNLGPEEPIFRIITTQLGSQSLNIS